MKTTPQTPLDTTAQIRMLNDVLRTNPAHINHGRVVMTAGIASLPARTIWEVCKAVQTFDAFTPDNDPHEEHDFGSVTVDGHKVFWKIDYYDLAMKFHSPDPADPKVTRRVLTIMLASEY